MLLFVDGIKLFRLTNTVEECVCLQHDMCSILKWCLCKCLVLSESKPKVFALSRKRYITQFCYTLDTTVISRVYLIPEVGVYIDTEIFFIIKLRMFSIHLYAS